MQRKVLLRVRGYAVVRGQFTERVNERVAQLRAAIAADVASLHQEIAALHAEICEAQSHSCG